MQNKRFDCPGRPRRKRRIGYKHNENYFKPQGVPMSSLEVIELSLDEIEALRLKNVIGLDQIDCAKKMNVSQSTFQRILSSSYKKVSFALVEGKAIKIIK